MAQFCSELLTVHICHGEGIKQDTLRVPVDSLVRETVKRVKCLKLLWRHSG